MQSRRRKDERAAIEAISRKPQEQNRKRRSLSVNASPQSSTETSVVTPVHSRPPSRNEFVAQIVQPLFTPPNKRGQARELREQAIKMRISPATTALRNNLGRTDPDTRADPFLRHEPADKKVALRVVGLTKRYGTTTAVSGLNFEIREGEIFGLLGPNGAGKTTTIAMLATQRLPSSGDATLFGHSARKDPYRVRQMIGLAPQEVSLYPALTAAENLQFFGRIYGVKAVRAA